jgi:anaphase-promoting complex subunit 1
VVCCGIGLGLIGLGTIRSNSQITHQLTIKLIQHIRSSASISTLISISIALGLLGLKSNDENIAQVLAIPTTTYGLDYLTPELLMIRVICKSLVMFDDIQPSLEWVISQVPFQISSTVGDLKSQLTTKNDHAYHCYFSLIIGLGFVIALKYAGTNNTQVKNTLIQIADILSHRYSFKGILI